MTDKPRILIARYFPGLPIDKLSERFDVDWHDDTVPLDRDELQRRIAGAVAVISYGDSIDRDVLVRAERLKVVADFWGGGSVDVAAARERGVIVAGAGGVDWIVWSEAEHAIALLLAVARRIPEADRFVKSGRWTQPEQSVRELRGSGLHGRTVGIVNGSRRAGVELVERLQGWGARILHSGEVRSDEVEAAGAEYAERGSLLVESDYVVLLHGDFTRHEYVLSADDIAGMKPGASLISITLGRAIDEKALVVALQEGRIAGAALDKLENQPVAADGLTELEQVVLTPHADGALARERAAMTRALVDACLAVVEGRTPEFVVAASGE